MATLVIIGVYACIATFAMYQVNRALKVRVDSWSKMSDNKK